MKKPLLLCAAVLAGAMTFSSAAPAHDYKTGNLTIMHPWARATAKSAKTGAAYLMISNSGTTDDKLVDVKSDVSKKTQIHQSSMENEMMKMEHVDAVAIPAGGKAELKPGGYHIMLMGLKAPLEVDAKFPLTLVFEKNGEVTVDVVVSKGEGMKMLDHNTGQMKMKP